MAKKLSRNDPCPCGSGKKYKRCCWGQDVDDDSGTGFRTIPMTGELEGLFEEQHHRFVQRFGREPGPSDPVFFDALHPEYIEAMTSQVMKDAGLDPALIYAFEKTGRLVTECNQHLLSDADLDEWNAAIEEYESKHPRRDDG
ncbi:MAG: SEC-C metal-binding domain-containing protein [Gemmataceae bacterium]